MFIATTTPDARPSSVGAAWMVDVALPQGFCESGGASGHNMSPLRGWADRAARLAINMPPLWGLANRAVRLAINMSPLRGLYVCLSVR